MSERKVLTKYYPPDFDPSKIERSRKPKGEKPGRQLQTVRLMAPFSMKCTTCGEYIYKGRKFNARKETTDEKYQSAISIFRFYIRCTRCSAEITFKTDPKNTDYTCERGARRNFEPWRESKLAEETEEEMLDRLEREEGEKGKMTELEKKTNDARTEMAIADALDDVRMRNAARERATNEADGVFEIADEHDEEKDRVERELAEEAKAVFRNDTGQRVRRISETPSGSDIMSSNSPRMTFVREPKARKDFSVALGIKRTASPVAAPAPPQTSTKPALVTGYDSDSDD
ncbi:DUF572-domain-containing protein [Polychaeton citri CBS 116435]|uniref:Splicing factor YJU2 n=1 Tax=Polychaeton citri CBS 116435 TaxID=1314669 RepID=A0A9P4Q172_9PEZI|nr:DUF572-domain-containing protein [Polychaeton citri CBS 116435]